MKTTTRSPLPELALGAGLLGIALRLWLLATGIDDLGLIRPHHPANYLTTVLFVAVLLELLLGLRPVKRTPAYERMFPPSRLAAFGSCIAALGIVFTSLQDRSAQQNPIIGFLSLCTGLLAGVCLIIAAFFRFRGRRPHYTLHSAVTVYLMIHLVGQYASWNIAPQLSTYLLPLFASILLTVTSYYRACLDAGMDVRKKFLFFCYSALFLCCTAAVGKDWRFYGSMAVWLATLRFSPAPLVAPMPMQLPKPVLLILDTLEKAGYRAYTVGGCVRDWLLGLQPHDYDICTNATPEQICSAFADLPQVLAGEKHGTVGIILDDRCYEITTFRTEGSYSDGRHPDRVTFIPSVEADLARRDFTVNAIAYSPYHGYIDPWGGQADLEQGILRCVGDPETRLREDALRIMRGVRFAVTYGLTPTEDTSKAMQSLTPLLDGLARERVFSELCKLLPLMTAQDLLTYAPIITQVIPELSAAVDFDQHSPYHAYDVYTHTAHAVAAVPPMLDLRLAALLHDAGKPATFSADETGRGHFHEHAKAGAQLADTVLLRLRAPNQLRENVIFLIENHMLSLPADKKILRRRLSAFGEERVRMLLALQKADFHSKGICDEADPFPEVEALLEEICREDTCLSIGQLAINGHDLIAMGEPPGPRIGQCLSCLLSMVQDETLPNEADALLLAAQDILKR